LWIAAWAVQHNAFLATQNIKHFRHVADPSAIHPRRICDIRDIRG